MGVAAGAPREHHAGRSHCPSCGHQIRAYDNIPVLSWLLLRGRCRDCGATISWRYPAGEALTAALYVGVVLLDGLDWVLVPHLLFVSALVLVSQVDLEVRLIPDVVILPVAAVGVPLMILFGDGPVVGVAGGGRSGRPGFLFLISEVYYRVRHVEGMGFGDVKLALCMGVYLGAAVVPALFIGFLSGAVIGVAVDRPSRKADGKTAIPFGPFLAAGAVVALFVGAPLIDAYLGLALGR